MSHLGTRVAALADGQLPATEAEPLLAHAAACPRCEWLLAQERASRAMLSSAEDVEPDPELTARLLALTPGPEQPGGSSRRGRVLLAGAGVGALAGAVVVGLVVVGGISEQRADPRTILEAANGTGERPADLPEGLGTDEANGDIVAWLAAEGWSAPETLPQGMRVVEVEVHETEAGEVLEVEIAGAMAHVRLVQQRGVLPPETQDELQTELVDAPDTVPLTTGVHDVALQSKECVVVVLAAADDAPLSDAIRDALPAGDFDTSVPGRLVRGWHAVTDWARG